LFDGSQCLFRLFQFGQAAGLAEQRHCEVGEESVRMGGCEVAVGGDGFPDVRQGLFQPAHAGQDRSAPLDASALRAAINPYIQVAAPDERCQHTGLLRGHHTAVLLKDMERCVGESPPNRALARAIAGHLRQWGTREQLRRGYPDLVAWSGALRVPVTDPVTARFTLALADQPGLIITHWRQADRDELLSRILARPVLFRAARFAVLGTRAVHQPLDQATIAGGAR
jgi:hypothetical protein